MADTKKEAGSAKQAIFDEYNYKACSPSMGRTVHKAHQVDKQNSISPHGALHYIMTIAQCDARDKTCSLLHSELHFLPWTLDQKQNHCLFCTKTKPLSS